MKKQKQVLGSIFFLFRLSWSWSPAYLLLLLCSVIVKTLQPFPAIIFPAWIVDSLLEGGTFGEALLPVLGLAGSTFILTILNTWTLKKQTLLQSGFKDFLNYKISEKQQQISLEKMESVEVKELFIRADNAVSGNISYAARVLGGDRGVDAIGTEAVNLISGGVKAVVLAASLLWLGIENQAETLLGITDKNKIEKSLGIHKFNEKCYEIVAGNNEAWKEYVEQMARWVDYEGAYKTMNLDFMESVMWAFKQCCDKGYIYRDYRVTPYCMHCETSLSISDTRESDSTRLRQDRWIIARFRTEELAGGKPVYFLAWTTTPWTLPSNMCLAVGEKLDYAYVEVGDSVYVACKNTLAGYEKVFGKDPVILKECKGSDLLGKTYEPLFDYFSDRKAQGAFRVVSAEYVGSEEGVGIVHTAPAFGEDDYWTCRNNCIPLVNPVDEKGRFTEEIRDFYDPAGEKNVIELNPAIIRFLYDNGKAVADGTIEHNYPHCWRCKRPLIYKAMDAWYFDIGKLKSRLIELNEDIHWVPETVKHGRFGNWLAVCSRNLWQV